MIPCLRTFTKGSLATEHYIIWHVSFPQVAVLVNELAYIHKMIVGITGCHMENTNAVMTNKS